MPYFDPYDPANSNLQRAVTGTRADYQRDPQEIPGTPAADVYNRTSNHITASQKRDQWSGANAVTGGNFGNLEGFDAANFGNNDMQTLKYQVGRIMSRHDPNDPDILGKIMSDPEFRANFPGAKQVGPDKIDFGDGRPVDVIRGHGASGAKFSWQTEDTGVSGKPSYESHPYRGTPTPTTPTLPNLPPGTNTTMPVGGVPYAYQPRNTSPQIQLPPNATPEMKAYFDYLQTLINSGRTQ